MTATSGTYAFNPEVADIVVEAFERIGKQADFLESPGILQSVRRSMNLIQSDWSNKGPNLWKVSLLPITLIQGTTTYTLPLQTVMVLNVYLTTVGQSDRILSPISRATYAALPQKLQQGPPTQYYLDRQIDPKITFWEVPDLSATYTANCYVFSQQQDVTAGAQGIDVPFRWWEALCSELAFKLAVKFAPTLAPALQSLAGTAYLSAANEDVERVPINIIPNMRGYS